MSNLACLEAEPCYELITRVGVIVMMSSLRFSTASAFLLFCCSAARAAQLAPILANQNISESFSLYNQDGPSYYDMTLTDVIAPQSYTYYVPGAPYGPGHEITTASGGLLIADEPNPFLSLVGRAYSPTPAGEAEANISASISYQIEIIGAPGLVPVTVSAHGEVGGADVDSIYGSPPSASFSVEGAGVNISKSIYSYGLYSDFYFDSSYQFTANTIYDVDVAASVSAVAYSVGFISVEESAFVDPFFQIDPDYASDYYIDISPGVGNSVSSVPLPRTPPLFLSALIGLFGAGLILKRNGQNGKTGLQAAE